jgi:hypothetical protein
MRARPTALADSRADLRLALTVIAWVGLVLPLDRAGLGRELLLGAVTWALLLVLLWREDASTRAQVAIVVVFATFIEYTFSAGLGVYVYRLHQVPAYVPPGHGLVYLAALAIGRSAVARSWRRPLLVTTVVVAGGYAAWGLFVSARPDVLGFLWFCCLLVWVWRARSPLVFVGAFLVVTYLELLGTALGVWTWSLHDPTGLVAIGNPPSGAAGGYGFFDAAALAFAPRIVAWFRRSRGEDRQRLVVQPAVTCEGVAAVGTGHTSQIGEATAGLFDQELQGREVPQRHLGLARDVDDAFGHHRVRPEVPEPTGAPHGLGQRAEA